MIVVTNPTVLKYQGARLRKSLASFRADIVTVPDGERHKTLQTADRVVSRLVRLGADRHSVIVAFGGGVIGDLAGFVAATYMRGLRFVMVPTTLLAMADSSVGGKVAVNHPGGKNLIGAFHQPEMVLIDRSTLSTLPDREYYCGLAEIAKYGLAVDRRFFQWLAVRMARLVRRGPVVHDAVFESLRYKARIVSRDERDAGPRLVLNFGHTFGHALEGLDRYRAIRHGEAVWLGMLAAAHASAQTGLMDDDDFEEIVSWLSFPLSLLQASRAVRSFVLNLDPRDAVKWMRRDKKAGDGHLRLVLLERIGRAVVVPSPGDAQLRRSLGWMKTFMMERIRM